MKNVYDVIIIGAGPTGIYTAHLSYLHKLKSLLLESNHELGGQLNLFLDKPIYDLPGQLELDGKKMYENLYSQLSSESITNIIDSQKVLKIEGSIGSFKVFTNKNEYTSKTIIITTGGGDFEPIPLGIKNEHSFSNIYYSVKESEQFFGKNIVIFGGGDTAIDWSNYFYKNGSKVSLIHRRKTFRGQEHMLDEIKNKIKILTPYKIEGVEGYEKVEKIILKNIKTNKSLEMKCDAVFCFFGQKKNREKNDLFKIHGDENGYYVNSAMESSRKGIFVAGNIANYHGKVKMMITGFGEAATAVGSVVEIIKPGKKMSYYVKKKDN
jgi:thioredoxin reductase